MSEKILYLVVPCYNEEEAFPETAAVLKGKLTDLIEKKLIHSESRIMFVDDGSKDNTWQLISAYHQQDKIYTGVKLSRNRGHQNALLAGLMTARKYADITISMDADLQDDIDAVDEMVQQNAAGHDVVYGVRSSRKSDTFFKRFTAQTFYKLLKLLGVDIVYNHADFRLMSRRALDGLAEFDEANLFLRGLVPMVGYPSCNVYYERHKRQYGESKYNLRKMLSFSLEGITSLSVRPIKLIISIGMCFFLISIGILIYSLYQHFTGNTISGWTSLIVSIWAIGGLQLVAIGIIGEYIGKVYLESKRRPKYIIETTLD